MRRWMLLAVLTGGCATIVHGGKQDVWVDSFPAGAEVRINDIPTGNTPIMLELPRKEQLTLQLILPGYQTYQLVFDKSVSKWVAGNILLGGAIGLLVDAATGAVFYLSPEQVNAELVPLVDAPRAGL